MPIELYHLLITLFEALKAHEPESLTVTETQSFLKEAFNYESVKPTLH